jgi:hypothetical protein
MIDFSSFIMPICAAIVLGIAVWLVWLGVAAKEGSSALWARWLSLAAVMTFMARRTLHF